MTKANVTGGEDGHVALEMWRGWWRPWGGDGDGGGRGDGSDRDGDGGGGEVMVQSGMRTKVTQVSRLPARLWLLGTQASQP